MVGATICDYLLVDIQCINHLKITGYLNQTGIELYRIYGNKLRTQAVNSQL